MEVTMDNWWGSRMKILYPTSYTNDLDTISIVRRYQMAGALGKITDNAAEIRTENWPVCDQIAQCAPLMEW